MMSMCCTEEEVCKKLGWELGRSVEWSEVVKKVGKKVAEEYRDQDIGAMNKVRSAFGLAPFVGGRFGKEGIIIGRFDTKD